MRHKDVLDISALAGLRGIVEEEADWRFGASTTWTDLIDAELPPLFAGYKLAAREIGGVQIQNRGTLVGNICTASPAGDGAPNLLALEAEVELASLGGRAGCRWRSSSTAIATRPAAPTRSSRPSSSPSAPRRARGHFLKLGARALPGDLDRDGGRRGRDGCGGQYCRLQRIAVGACSAVPQRLSALEAALLGVPLAAAARSLPAGAPRAPCADR